MKQNWIVLVVLAVTLIDNIYSQDDKWEKLSENTEEYHKLGEHYHINSIPHSIPNSVFGRIIGGKKADITDHSHHVLLILTDATGNNSYCGGSIIKV